MLPCNRVCAAALSTTLSDLEALNVHHLTLDGIQGDAGIRSDAILQQIARLTGLQDLTLGVETGCNSELADASEDLLKLLPLVSGMTALVSLQIGTLNEPASGKHKDPEHQSDSGRLATAHEPGLVVLPGYDDEPWCWPENIEQVPAVVFPFSCAANLQRLEVPDLLLTRGSVLPVGLKVLTLKRILPEAVSVLAPLTGLQQLQLARVPNSVIEATAKALLPVVHGLTSLTDLTVHPSDVLTGVRIGVGLVSCTSHGCNTCTDGTDTMEFPSPGKP